MPSEDLFILMRENPKTALFLLVVFLATYYYGIYRYRNEKDFGVQYGFPLTGLLSGIIASLALSLAVVAVIFMGSSLGCSVAAIGLPFLVNKAFNRMIETESQPKPPSYKPVGKVLYLKR